MLAIIELTDLISIDGDQQCPEERLERETEAGLAQPRHVHLQRQPRVQLQHARLLAEQHVRDRAQLFLQQLVDSFVHFRVAPRALLLALANLYKIIAFTQTLSTRYSKNRPVEL